MRAVHARTYPGACFKTSRLAPSRSQQRAQEVLVFLVHVAVAVVVNPPAATVVARIPGAKLSLRVGRTCEFQLLEIFLPVVRQVAEQNRWAKRKRLPMSKKILISEVSGTGRALA